MRVKFLAVGLVVLASVLITGVARAGEVFDGCGTIVMGVECDLFAADSGGTYIVNFPPGYGVGDRVHIVGTIDPFCISFCQQGNGCLYPTLLEVCTPSCPCEWDGIDGVDVFDLLAYLGDWFAGNTAAEFDGANGIDVFDLLAYLECWFPASAGNCP